MLINARVKDLVGQLEQDELAPALSHKLIVELVNELEVACQRTEAKARYAGLYDSPASLLPYPMDGAGFAVSFDPIEDEEGFVEAFRQHGLVVGHQVVPARLCTQVRGRMADLLEGLSDGACQLDKPETWGLMPVDSVGVPILTRGFFEVYHDAVLAELRQAVRVYIHHVLIWGRTDLWTSFDRLGVKLPEHGESGALPLHVDQNPKVHPGFRTLQGVLALDDCPVERGTFLGVAGSRDDFGIYADMTLNMGEHVELAGDSKQVRALRARAQPIPLRAGDMVSWDSRTTHANTANVSDKTRFVAYLSAGPAPKDASLAEVRNEAFASGVGSNVRDALMHASKKPRYTAPEALAGVRKPEKLTLLGELLYGQKPWAEVMHG